MKAACDIFHLRRLCFYSTMEEDSIRIIMIREGEWHDFS